jgi:hypothetical protein
MSKLGSWCPCDQEPPSVGSTPGHPKKTGPLNLSAPMLSEILHPPALLICDAHADRAMEWRAMEHRRQSECRSSRERPGGHRLWVRFGRRGCRVVRQHDVVPQSNVDRTMERLDVGHGQESESRQQHRPAQWGHVECRRLLGRWCAGKLPRRRNASGVSLLTFWSSIMIDTLLRGRTRNDPGWLADDGTVGAPANVEK